MKVSAPGGIFITSHAALAALAGGVDKGGCGALILNPRRWLERPASLTGLDYGGNGRGEI